MIKENKIKKYVVVIICLLGMLILSGKTENVFANDKKSKDMENSLLSFYIKDVSNVESIKYIPLDKKIIGNKRITDKSNVVDIGFGEYYIKAKDEKKELQEPSYSSWYEAPKGGMQFREKLSIEYQVNKDYNNKNLRILKKVVEENIHPKNKVLDYDELVAEGEKNNILAVSNPAFELFLLLHYENSYEDDIEPNAEQIIQNEKDGHQTFIYKLLLARTGINPKKNSAIGELAKNIEIAIEQEKKINEDIHQCKGQITCNIGRIIDDIRNDDGK